MRWFRFLRTPNLLIVALTQYLVRHAVLAPVYRRAGVAMDLDAFQFALLVLATMLVTAAGYLVNDLYDASIDRVNRPDRVYVGSLISPDRVRMLYGILTVLGGLLATYLAVRLDYLRWLALYPLSVAGLWAYTVRLKRTVLWGNLVVGVFSAGVVLLVWLAEQRSFVALQRAAPGEAGHLAATFVFYAVFALVSTLFREVVKDLEDRKGDEAEGCRTLPVILGPGPARQIAFGLLAALALAVMLYLLAARAQVGSMTFLYAGAFLLAPMGYLGVLLARAHGPADYHRISTATKLVMLAGLLFLPVIFLFA